MPCENCHTTTAWKPIRREPEFNHNTQTHYPLLGMHEGVPCQSCHRSLVFSKAPTACAECHADLHQRQLGSNCQECHTVRGWKVAVSAIQQHNNRFPLLGAHAAATCDDCHHGAATGVYTGLSTQCIACHQKDFQNAASLNHVAAKISTTCETCHNVNVWQGARFDHGQVTGFVLTGAHATVACSQCHVGNRFVGTPTACFGCHANDFTHTTNPSHIAAGFPQDCSTCHTTATWSDATFNHNAFSSFALTGAHVTVSCNQCHANGQFANAPTSCDGCHLADYGRTTNPNHRSLNFPTACDTCHTTANWQNAKFDHNISGFPLTGAHVSVSCGQCHLSGNFTTASKQCVGCHLADFQKAGNPNHVSAGFPQDCSMCHNTVQWNGATFNHTSTGFTLTGAHASVQCNQCHTNNNFSLTSASCWNCHQTDYNNTSNPSHKAANFPQDCSICHTTTNWNGAAFNHATTGFALTGAHNNLQCGQCHTNNNFSLTSTSCWNCHQTDYNNTSNPSHKAASFPQDCSICHTTTNWDGAAFNHTTTGFALTGAHNNLQCGQCHTNNNFALTSTACWNCHQADFNNTNNPPHKASNFPQDCSLCHTTTNWDGATFNHTTTGFALTGAHTSLQCGQCHVNNNFSLTGSACWNCHQADYNGTTDPPHKASNFPQDCSGCHTTTNWGGATFNHASTGFALAGVHASTQCTSCHVNNNYGLTNAVCWNCHQTDYKNANNPPHASAGFPQDCTLCHGSSASNWTSATFNHTTTGFGLTGAHTPLQCAQCHVNNNYSLTNGLCWNCHQTDYNNTNDPSHKASNFPQDCSQCHTTVNWSGATFNHAATGFTLVGLHATAQCSACHANKNFSLTSAACWNCHQTDYNGANNPPHKAAGFPQDCTLCHGSSAQNWTSATFNHTTTGFALTGAHTALQCAQCHVNNNYSLTSGACWNCHQTDYNNTTDPPHKASNFPQDCSQCHTTTNWDGASFNHTATGFALVGLHATTKCSACHVNNNYSLTSAVCWNCHQTDYLSAFEK